MRFLTDDEERKAMEYLDLAVEVALRSSCYRSRCGSVIVKDGELIGEGFNSPPGNETLEYCFKDELSDDFRSDRTCCVHAEQRAVIDALRNGNDLEGSRLYFIRIDDNGEKLKAGKPYCTVCSKMALDVGVSEFVLLHEEGICVYDTEEYNEISFGLREWIN
jgi:dCMP deaminase